MATVYNKTALKKIKKDELIQMFLDKQAKLNDIEMEKQEIPDEEIPDEEIPDIDNIYEKAIELLEEQNELLEDKKELLEEKLKLKKENKKLKTQIDNLKGEVKFWTFKAEEFERKYIQTDENYKLHRKSADIYEEKLIEEIQILRKRYSQLQTEI